MSNRQARHEEERGHPVKRAVSFAVHQDGSGGGDRVLAVLRPPDDPDLPGLWGLPATSLNEGEGWEDALVRAGFDKLGITIEPAGVLSEGEQERPLEDRGAGDGEAHRLRMRVYEAVIRRGRPSVEAATGPGTRYADCRWVDPEELREAARQGSLCTRLYLERRRPEPRPSSDPATPLQ